MASDEDSDDEFRAALARGDESAWFVFHQRYTERLIRYARVIAKDEELARDAVQAIMVGLVRNRKNLDQVRDFEAYLFSALRRDLWRIVKRAKKEASLLVPLESDIHGNGIELPLDETKLPSLSHEERDSLMVALSQLKSEQRVAIELRFFGELTFEKIAAVLELPMGTVVSRFRAGLQQLRLRLEEQV